MPLSPVARSLITSVVTGASLISEALGADECCYGSIAAKQVAHAQVGLGWKRCWPDEQYEYENAGQNIYQCCRTKVDVVCA